MKFLKSIISDYSNKLVLINEIIRESRLSTSNGKDR
jgi:hypothetical protein